MNANCTHKTLAAQLATTCDRHEPKAEAAPKTPWASVVVTDGETDYRVPSPEHAAALLAYRNTGSINGYWPCTAAELAALGEDTDDAGPDVDQIDWTGIAAGTADTIPADADDDDPACHAVMDGETNERLDGEPTAELVAASRATDSGAVGAYLDGETWRHAPESDRDRLRSLGFDVRIVWID